MVVCPFDHIVRIDLHKAEMINHFVYSFFATAKLSMSRKTCCEEDDFPGL